MAPERPATSGGGGEMEQKQLVEAAQKDPARFAQLYELHFDRVYAYVVRRVRDRDAAEDLTAEVFHSALANLGRFEWRGTPFAAWLYRIAANAIADRARRLEREQVGSPPEVAHSEEPEETEYRARIFGMIRQ